MKIPEIESMIEEIICIMKKEKISSIISEFDNYYFKIEEKKGDVK